MGPMTELLVSERIRDLEREAASHSHMTFDEPATASRPAWRRHGGAAARRLSLALAGLAAELDPTLRRASYGRE